MYDARPDIHLHIERLVLDSLPIGQAHGPQVQAAVEAELSRLLAEHGLAARLQGGGAAPSIAVAGIQLAPGSSPAQLGRQIAQSVFGGIGNGR